MASLFFFLDTLEDWKGLLPFGLPKLQFNHIMIQLSAVCILIYRKVCLLRGTEM